MNRTEIKKVLEGLTAEISTITDERVASILKTLFNFVEVLVEQNEALRKDNQNLRDEINRLKGEQGKPNIRQQTKEEDKNPDHSSEDERNKRLGKKPPKDKSKKKGIIKIDRQIVCDFDKGSLPDDAVFKGHETRVFQDVKITTNNVEFKLAVYWSPSLNKTFIAPVPKEYYGEFGPSIRALILMLYRDSGMTEPAIERFLKTMGIQISRSTISRMITEDHDVFHQEKEDIVNAGLKWSLYQHLDDTFGRFKGMNWVVHVLCSRFYTAFFTRPNKERLTILEFLCRGELKFEFNKKTYNLMAEFGLSEKRLIELKKNVGEKIMTRQELEELLIQIFPDPKKHLTNRSVIREASALIYYRGSPYAIEHLICDDAPQFERIAKHKELCWVHAGRHYKKLNPIVAAHRVLLDNFIGQFWDYYQALLTYQNNPSVLEAQQLKEKFEVLFATKTGYEALDKRIAMTLAKQDALLLVLKFPFLPLHNNPAELGARAQARMRDINLQTCSENGTKAKDTFATIVQTSRKLSVNIYDYFYDRVSKKFEMPSLASLVAQQSALFFNIA